MLFSYVWLLSQALRTKLKGEPIKLFFEFVNKPGINKSLDNLQ